MGRIVVQMQSSIDGFVGSDDPSSQWALWNWGPHWPWSADLRAQFNETFAGAAGILLSRPMAEEGYLDHWQRVAADNAKDPDYAFAQRIGRLPKFIVTGQAVDRSWPRSTVISGSFVEAVTRAKESAEGTLLCFGGAGLVTGLLGAGLVDELQLYVNPGIAVAGQRIFGDLSAAARFTLLDATPTDCGIVVVRWQPPNAVVP